MPPAPKPSRLSLIGHFVDRGAAISESKKATRDSVALLVPALVSLLGFPVTLVSNALASTPVLSGILLIWLVALVVCVRGIVSTRMAKGATQARYRHPQLIRNGAKALSVLLLLLVILTIWRIIPNGIRGTTTLAGNLCSAIGDHPINGASIEVLDRAGYPVAQRSEQSGDDGFFFHDLRWGGQVPAELRVHIAGCPVQSIPVAASIAGRGCSGGDQLNHDQQPVREKWVLSCPAA